jgi:hypothetical protein
VVELAPGISHRTVLKAMAVTSVLGPAALLSFCLGGSSGGRHLVMALRSSP